MSCREMKHPTKTFSDEMAHEWRREAETLDHRGLHQPAHLIRSLADELLAAAEAWLAEELSLGQAAKSSGLAYSTVQHRLTKGSLPNVGRKGQPRVRRGDLPYRGETEDPGDELIEARLVEEDT